ncbi:hypothetical protein G7Z17_g5380 [Cylindrodendrum hubeiense]|uniref:Protein kinase domain-containing protein n=1 Tax=Cylindrodendrum hubeiense TaxID=595255 RepID=A0A9P5HE96_9HYPO|nr:hypothetical protein G7Z17_g5380 [Cylindrodendrum hubeiense]
MTNYQRPFYESLGGDDELPVETSTPHQPTESTKMNDSDSTYLVAKPITRVLPDELFRRGLAKFLPQPNDPLLDKRILLDAVFPAISQLLLDHGKYEWSLRPRTFSLLWMLGTPEKMATFVAEGRTDHYLPYNEGNLPDIIKGTTQRSRFLNLQSIVRCRREEDISELEEGGRHVHLRGGADAYFHSLKVLGTGRFAEVDEVYSMRTLNTYARKQIHRGQSVLEDKFRLASFEKELQALKAISHRHVVKLVGSYTDSTALGLIMRPVANTDLHQYLNSADVDSDLRKKSLRGFFGCLVTALAYVHKKNIRHKDIKPNNVLVKDGRILLADFGTSRICLDGHLTTNGESKEGTPRYWGPEVMEGSDRNTASDIWSLGCVFLEMATILFGHTHNEMLGFFSQHGTENYRTICLNEPATRLWIEKLRGSGAAFDIPVLDWTEWMLQEKPSDRPTAAQLRSTILDTQTEYEYICHHCASRDGIENSESPASGTMVSINPSVGAQSETGKTTLAPENQELKFDNGVSEIIGVPSAPTQKLSPPAVQYCEEGCKQERLTTNEENEPAKLPQNPSPKVVAEPKKPEKKRVTFAVEGDDIDLIVPELVTESNKESGSKRFVGLPEDQRPEPTSRGYIHDDEDFDRDQAFIAPEPIKPPPLYHHECLPLPEASLIPSYILAGTNHLSRREVEDARVDPGTTNIFVYGRLMFPSVLHAIASQSTKGAYSPDLQRRLVLESRDWSKANLSLQRTTELMTPAFLRGYSRWQPEGLDCAVIQKVTQSETGRNGTSPTSHGSPNGVVGFLISGVAREAIRYFDLIFASTERNLVHMKPATSDERYDDRSETDSLLQRQSVGVEVELNTGEVTTVHAHTYVWKYEPIPQNTTAVVSERRRISDPRWRYGNANVAWNGNDFVHGQLFQGILLDNASLRQEEKTIATQMKIAYALSGDYLCRAIMAGDIRELRCLLKANRNPNSLCRVYGSPLQASVAIGNEDMVKLLIDHGANANTNAGRYGTPLIAAAFASRKSITRLLLHKGADVFATHPVHANALYQAVGHSDYAIAEMLLEHAAWLMDDWGELCDLAEETGDSEIRSLIRQYDVREIHRGYLLARPNKRFVSIAERPSYRTIFSTIIRKGISVQGMSGNWKGRKGVAVLVAALNAGASIEIIPFLRHTVGPSRDFIDALKKSDEIEELKYQKALEGGVMYSDEEDWSASDGEDTPDNSDVEYQRIEPRRKRSTSD